MKLKMISEIQYKFPPTIMDRANASATYSANSINDLYRNKLDNKKIEPEDQPEGEKNN